MQAVRIPSREGKSSEQESKLIGQSKECGNELNPTALLKEILAFQHTPAGFAKRSATCPLSEGSGPERKRGFRLPHLVGLKKNGSAKSSIAFKYKTDEYRTSQILSDA